MVATYQPATWNKPLGQVPPQERADVLEATIAATVGELEQDLESGFTDRFLEVLRIYSHFRKYSFGNVLLIAEQMPTATRVAGFRTWQKLGYHVRKGEKALFVRAPRLKKEGEETVLLGFMAMPVFDISQVEGEGPLPDFTMPLEGEYDSLLLMSMVNVSASGILVTQDPMPVEVHGISWGGRITLNKDLSPSEQLLALYHELAHEQSDHHQVDVPKRQKELEAESCAWILAKLNGLEHPFASDYIKSWRGTVENLRDSMHRIQVIVAKCCDILEIQLKEAPGAA